MGWYPGAIRRPLHPEADTQPPMAATQVILHTIEGSAQSAYNTFLTGNLESHFIVHSSGEVWQLIPTNRSADANYHANLRLDGTGAISVETEDDGTPEDTPWTDAQLTTIADIIAWACGTYDIPLRRCAAPHEPGIGYHSMFGAPSEWTDVPGKTCPAPARIAQFDEVLVVAGAALERWPSLPSPPAGNWLEDPVALPVIRLGDRGDPVRRVQGLLLAAGHPVVVDGEYGPATAAEVRDFQSRLGLEVDAVVGRATWRRLVVG